MCQWENRSEKLQLFKNSFVLRGLQNKENAT